MAVQPTMITSNMNMKKAIMCLSVLVSVLLMGAWRQVSPAKTSSIVKDTIKHLVINNETALIADTATTKTANSTTKYQTIHNESPFVASTTTKSTTKMSATTKKKTSNEQNRSNLSPLYFIMHVGPMKTASSTIQCSLINLEKQALLPENIVIAETNNKSCQRMIRKGHKTINACLQMWKGKTKKMPECWTKEYVPYIKEQEKHNRSIIVSQENLSWLVRYIRGKKGQRKQFLEELQKSIGDRYQIVVIITYRTFFDWVYSYYYQKNAMSDNRDLVHWPDEGGKKVDTPERYSKSMQEEGGDRIYFADKLLDFFSSNNNISIKLMNLDDGDIMRQFLCDSLPLSLSHTMCNLVDKIALESDMNVASDTLWCNTLAVKAHEKGMIHSNITREKVIYDVLDYQKEHGLLHEDFPLLCPSHYFYDILLNKTLKVYSNVFRNSDYQQKQDKEREYRERLSKKKNKFCTVNANKMLEEEIWKSFFNRYSTNTVS